MNQSVDEPRAKTIGGRHGSPTITIAFPFSQVKAVDSDVRGAVAQLAELIAELARKPDDAGREAIRKSALDLADRMHS